MWIGKQTITKLHHSLPHKTNYFSSGSQLTYPFCNPDPATYFQLFKIWANAMPKLANVEGISVEYVVRPHPVTNGTNLFSLWTGKTDDVMVDMTSAYTNKADDAPVAQHLGTFRSIHAE